VGDPVQLPVPGYPMSEQAVTDWFRLTYHREPSELEVGTIIDAMARREVTLPEVGPRAEPDGWSTGISAPPATRR
jgi:hypothetical protein